MPCPAILTSNDAHMPNLNDREHQVQVFGAQVAVYLPTGISAGAFEEALAAYTDQAARTHPMRLPSDQHGLAAAWDDERAAR